jgi:hypothetical protein
MYVMFPFCLNLRLKYIKLQYEPLLKYFLRKEGVGCGLDSAGSRWRPFFLGVELIFVL